MPEILECPDCGKKLRVSDDALGKAVTCPDCGKRFTATAEGSPPDAVQDGPAPRRASAVDDGGRREERPSRRRPRDDDEDEDDRPRRRRRDDDEDEDDRPGRRRARDEDDGDDRPGRRGRRSNAANAVKGPGIAFLIIGTLGLLMGGLYVVQAINGGTLLARNNQAVQDPTVYWIIAVVSLIWGAVVTLGGTKMLQMQSRGSVMVACVFAMLPCNPCFLAGLPVAIWALVMLTRPGVKEAFD
jgi:predicted Zn finger-like uncharacterized protein